MIEYLVVPMGEIVNKGYDAEKIESAFKKFSCHREIDLEDFLVHKTIPYENTNYGKTMAGISFTRHFFSSSF